MVAPFAWVQDLIQSHLVVNYPTMVEHMAWKNLTFDPAGRNVWLKIINAPVTEDAITLGPTGHKELRGFLQIGIYTAITEGTVESEIAYNRVNEIFDTPQWLSAPTDCVLRLTNKGFSQGGQTSIADFTRGGTEGVWDANYLTIYWLAREPKQRI